MLTKHVELPSKGLYYSQNHPLFNKQTIEVKLFTAKEQDILTDQNLAKSGQTIDVLLQSIIVDKNIKPKNLLSGDRTAILIKSREYSLGGRYSFVWPCSCGEQNKDSIDLQQLKYKSQPQKATKPIFKLVLPVSGKMIEFKLLNGIDQDTIRKIQNNRRKGELASATITTRLAQMIVSVDGDTDAGKIYRFVQQMPSKDTKALRDRYIKNSPDVNTQISLQCKNCKSVRRTSLPITAQFFRAGQ